jgi:hypothetical protein
MVYLCQKFNWKTLEETFPTSQNQLESEVGLNIPVSGCLREACKAFSSSSAVSHVPDIKSRQAFPLTTLEMRVLTKSAYSSLVYSGEISLIFALLQSGARSENGGMQSCTRVFIRGGTFF